MAALCELHYSKQKCKVMFTQKYTELFFKTIYPILTFQRYECVKIIKMYNLTALLNYIMLNPCVFVDIGFAFSLFGVPLLYL